MSLGSVNLDIKSLLFCKIANCVCEFNNNLLMVLSYHFDKKYQYDNCTIIIIFFVYIIEKKNLKEGGCF